MNAITEWSHRYFGFWKGTRPHPEMGPAIEDFIDRQWGYAQIDKLLLYLTQAPCIIPYPSLDCPICGPYGSSGAVRTDGHWLWRDDVADHMLAHGVRIPDNFVRHIEMQDYIPPPRMEFKENQFTEMLEWSEKIVSLALYFQRCSSGEVLIFDSEVLGPDSASEYGTSRKASIATGLRFHTVDEIRRRGQQTG